MWFIISTAVLGLLSIVLTIVVLLQLRALARYDRLIEKLRERMEIDPLTSLLNRAGMMRELNRLNSLLPISADKRSTVLETLSILFIDLDHFKQINDTYGHAIGDEVLCQVSLALPLMLRESDVVARYGGEEIVVLLPNVCNGEAEQVAEKIRLLIAAQHFSVEDLRVTASIGVACTRVRIEAEKLLARADQAMYQAKAGGRNKVVLLKAHLAVV